MSVVDEVKQKLDIVDVVSETVRLRKSGKSFSGFCPFHSNTRTPAFYVFPETQTWHCFGACNTGGDLFTFVQKRDGLDFGEALRRLAQRAGVPLVREGFAEDAERKKLREVVATAAAFFHYQLKNHPAAQSAREYIAKRFITPEAIETFELGYALNEWEATRNYMRGKGYSDHDLETAGLIVKRESEQGGYYDRFRGRLMFPIRNRSGEVVGFGARTLTGDEPKYLNSPQTALFDKSGTLYGIDQAKDAIRAQDLAVIVEGYTDVIGAHQAGFKNVVASLGTALTEKQLGLLKRLTKRYALALDPDVAGEEATKRGLEVAREALDRKTVPIPVDAGLLRFEERLEAELLVIALPPGQDPDELIHDNPAQWMELVKHAEPLVDFYFRVRTQDLNLQNARDKSTAVKRLAPIIREIGDAVQRAHYIQKLARLVNVPEKTIAAEIGRRVTERAKSPEPAPIAVSPAEASLGETCLMFGLLIPDHLARLAFLGADDFVDAQQRALFVALRGTVGPIDREALDETLAPLYDRLAERGKAFAEMSESDLRGFLEKAAHRLRLQRFKSEGEFIEAELARLQTERLKTGLTVATEEERQLHEREEYYLKGIIEGQRALNALVIFKSRSNIAELV